MSYLSRLEDEISAWPNVSVHPHRFGGKEFRFGKAEIGHVHREGTVDIPFPRAVRDALLEEGQAESTVGFRTLGGLLFIFVVKPTSAMPLGSCGSLTCAMR
jgi:hypothetical protein